jgi:hypothetical protein
MTTATSVGATRPVTSNLALPELVQRYLERSLPPDGAAPQRLGITQVGQMWQEPGARAMRFTARQRFAVHRVAFAWRARFDLAGPLAMEVVDEYEGGSGRLVVRLLGVPLRRESSAETAVGEAQRYLAELPWVPYAMAANRELEWRDLGSRSVEVATSVGAERVAVALDFDASGDIVRASSPARPRQVGKTSVPTPWKGEFGEYRDLGGIRIPTHGEVCWELPEGPFTYWSGTVTSLELDPDR